MKRNTDYPKKEKRMELAKGQKKIARLLIDEGLQRECAAFLSRIKQMLNNSEEENPHKNYLALFEEVYNFDKHIAWRYDRLGGSRYFDTVAQLYYENALTTEDINRFNEETKEKLEEWKKITEDHFGKAENMLH